VFLAIERYNRLLLARCFRYLGAYDAAYGIAGSPQKRYIPF
jgi:hypothetical protein